MAPSKTGWPAEINFGASGSSGLASLSICSTRETDGNAQIVAVGLCSMTTGAWTVIGRVSLQSCEEG